MVGGLAAMSSVCLMVSLTGVAFGAGGGTDWKGDPEPGAYSDWSASTDPSVDDPTGSDPALAAIPEQDFTVNADDAGDTSVVETPTDSLLNTVAPSAQAPERGAQVISIAGTSIVNSTCYYPFSVKKGTPAPPAKGNPFSVARVGLNGGSGQDEGGVQAESTHRGTPTDSKSVRSEASFLLAFKWAGNMPQGSSVVAHMNPAWRGKIALQAIQTTTASSTAKAHFHLGSGFWDKTLAQHQNDQTYADFTHTVSGTGNKRWKFSHPATTSDSTFGINLVPGHTYYFYSYASSYAEVVTDYTAPAAAAIDFGSKFLDTPASMTNSDGTSVNGFGRPGTGTAHNKVTFVFKVPGYFVNC